MLPTSRSSHLLLLVWAACLMASAARAQDLPDPSASDEGVDRAPAHISAIDGRVLLEREGRVEEAAAHVPLLAGDRLRSEQGRAEVLFGDGSVLSIDHYTLVDLQSDTLLRLLLGRARLTVAAGAPLQYRIDTASGWVRIEEPGDYRVSLLTPAVDRLDVELVVFRGAAELENESGRTLVRAGERAVTLNRAMPGYAQPYNVAYWDAFERWVEDRREARLGVVSSQYLPQELYSYGGTFDTYGSWQSHASYGYVWVPRVPVGWRPYYRGRWDYYRPYGWTWIGYDPWGWPTHHYGRWGYHLGLWFWVPTRRWGPAWVSWSVAPGFIGWCPRGWNGRPVIGFHARAGYDPWRAWTVVPAHRFVPGFAVARHSLGASAIPRGATFVTSAAAPVRADRAGFAVPRSAPLSSIGRSADTAVRRYPDVAVPRGTRLPGTVPAMPAAPLPSEMPGRRSRQAPAPETGQPLEQSPGAAGVAVPRSRTRDAGVGGGYVPPPYVPAPDRDRRSDDGYETRRRAPEYAVPRGVPSPGTVPAMPATRLPSESAPPPARMRPMPEPSAPPPSRAPERGARHGGEQAAPREGPRGPDRAVPRGGSPSGGGQSAGSSGGAPARRRPGN